MRLIEDDRDGHASKHLKGMTLTGIVDQDLVHQTNTYAHDTLKHRRTSRSRRTHRRRVRCERLNAVQQLRAHGGLALDADPRGQRRREAERARRTIAIRDAIVATIGTSACAEHGRARVQRQTHRVGPQTQPVGLAAIAASRNTGGSSGSHSGDGGSRVSGRRRMQRRR